MQLHALFTEATHLATFYKLVDKLKLRAQYGSGCEFGALVRECPESYQSLYVDTRITNIWAGQSGPRNMRICFDKKDKVITHQRRKLLNCSQSKKFSQ